MTAYQPPTTEKGAAAAEALEHERAMALSNQGYATPRPLNGRPAQTLPKHGAAAPSPFVSARKAEPNARRLAMPAHYDKPACKRRWCARFDEEQYGPMPDFKTERFQWDRRLSQRLSAFARRRGILNNQVIDAMIREVLNQQQFTEEPQTRRERLALVMMRTQIRIHRINAARQADSHHRQVMIEELKIEARAQHIPEADAHEIIREFITAPTVPDCVAASAALRAKGEAMSNLPPVESVPDKLARRAAERKARAEAEPVHAAWIDDDTQRKAFFADWTTLYGERVAKAGAPAGQQDEYRKKWLSSHTKSDTLKAWNNSADVLLNSLRNALDFDYPLPAVTSAPETPVSAPAAVDGDALTDTQRRWLQLIVDNNPVWYSGGQLHYSSKSGIALYSDVDEIDTGNEWNELKKLGLIVIETNGKVTLTQAPAVDVPAATNEAAAAPVVSVETAIVPVASETTASKNADPVTGEIIVNDAQRAIERMMQRSDIMASIHSQKLLKPGIDYGVIPGTDDKKTLLKPGAEKLCTAFGLCPEFHLVDKVTNWTPDAPLFYFQYECRLIDIATGRAVATGIGSCNSMESKYRWRAGKRVCPKCGKELRKSKDKPEFYCWTKTDGCGATYKETDPLVKDQHVGKIPNDDIFSLINTLDKMAQKRALIAATLIGANASAFYTQDVENLPQFGFIDAEIIEDEAA